MADRRTTARDLAQVAVFAALLAALGLPGTVTLGTTAVPITLQTLGVMLAGGLLGARRGLLAVLVFDALVLAGLPLLAGGRGGIGVLAGVSAGYLVGWLPGVVVIGLLSRRLLPRRPLWLGIVVQVVGGIVVIYAIGVPWTAVRAHLPLWTAVVDAGKFLPGDAVKAVVAAAVCRQVHRAYPGLLAPRTPATGRTGAPV
ncbi:biotin transporter BioY [Nakamurella endophytica]|uniref:Biotin transporter n=1 Tax=Nakamurella endophytica TaxID=1748367 RepID=A0A917WBB8_9ACTN|nr:biotin transporter BioY [Nakamurella endophytica]GGL88246.1 BioY family transporter [Nakamurella endophytica]